MAFAVRYYLHPDAQNTKAVIRFGGTEMEEKPCCEVGTGAKPWTFSRSTGRKESAFGTVEGEERTKSPGAVRGEP